VTSHDYLISTAEPHDVPAIHALIRGLAEYERLADACQSTEADIANALFGAKPAAEALIAKTGGKNGVAVGFALFFHTFSTFRGRRGLWLEDLFVEPAHRGHGVGRRLLTMLATLARERDCARFEWAVLDWNAPAIGFYESLGATLLTDWRIVRVTGQALDALARRHE
jgi:GNAT superfamily N-acetyltransferase